MQVQKATPEEMPNQREREMHPDSYISKELSEIFSNQPEKQQIGPKTDKKNHRGRPERNEALRGLNHGDPDIILRPSGEKNKGTVIKRMKNHMEAFPETKDGFLVYFNDTTGFKVEIYNGKGDSDIIIDGIKYNIIPYEFSAQEVSHIENEKINTKLSHLLYEDENGYPTLNLEESI